MQTVKQNKRMRCKYKMQVMQQSGNAVDDIGGTQISSITGYKKRVSSDRWKEYATRNISRLTTIGNHPHVHVCRT
jgi:hypothetical protein